MSLKTSAVAVLGGVGLFWILVAALEPEPFSSTWWLLLLGATAIGQAYAISLEVPRPEGGS